jgi:hypothetical protein
MKAINPIKAATTLAIRRAESTRQWEQRSSQVPEAPTY